MRADVRAGQSAENASAAAKEHALERAVSTHRDIPPDRRELRTDRAAEQRSSDNPQQAFVAEIATPRFAGEHDRAGERAEKHEQLVRWHLEADDDDRRLHGPM